MEMGAVFHGMPNRAMSWRGLWGFGHSLAIRNRLLGNAGMCKPTTV